MVFLDNNRIDAFIRGRFRDQKGVGEKFLEFLQRDASDNILELTTNSVFLSVLCDNYNETRLNSSQYRVYNDMFETLLNKVGYVNIDFNLSMLSEVAYYFFTKNEKTFKKYRVLCRLQDFIDRDFSKYNEDVEDIFENFCRLGIFCKEGETYRFSLVSIQEFLTAKHIFNNKRGKDVINSVEDFRYYYIFIFLMGAMGEEVNLFLLHIVSRYIDTINVSYIRSLLLNCKESAVFLNKSTCNIIDNLLVEN